MPSCINMKPCSYSLLILFFPIFIFGQTHRPVNTSSNLFDTCRTYLYYQQIGTQGFQKQVSKTRTIKDDGVLSVGYTSDGINKDALIIKQDRDGIIIWQKSYGSPGHDEAFTGFREYSSGEIITVGITKNNTTLKEGLLFCRFSSTGNLIWQRSYSVFQANRNVHNGKVQITYGDSVFFAAHSDSAIIYGLIDNSGNLIWQRAIRSTPSTELIETTNTGGGTLLIATNSMDTGRHVVKTYYIPYYQSQRKTIAFTRRFGGYYNNTNYISHDIEESGLYSYFSGIRSVNGGPYEFMRLNINQGYILQSVEKIVTPGIIPDSTARTAISIYGDCIAFTDRQKSRDIGLIKMTGSYNQNSYTYWSAKATLPDSIILDGCAKTWDAGYNIIGSKDGPGADKKIMQLKIDSASLFPICINRQSQSFSVQRDNENFSDTAAYTYVTDSLVVFGTAALSVNDLLADTLIYCKELKCPQVPVPDTCASSFFRLYRSYSNGETPNELLFINNSVYISGQYYDMTYHPDYRNSFITKLNTDGHILKQRILGISYSNGSRTIKTNDSALLYCGIIDSSGNYLPFVAKVDTNLNIIWSRTLHNYLLAFMNAHWISDVKQSADGSYYILGSDQDWFGDSRVLLMKLDVNGILQWSKIYRFTPPPGEFNFYTGRKLVLDNSYVYFTCRNDYNDQIETIVAKASLTNGNLVWCKKIIGPYNKMKVSDYMSLYNNELFFSGYYGQYPHKNIQLKMGTDGNIIKVTSHIASPSSSTLVYNCIQNTDGTLNLVTSYSSTGYSPYYLDHDCYVKLNSDLNVVNSKKMPITQWRNRKGIATGQNGVLYETGGSSPVFASQIPDGSLYLVKYSPDGVIGVCPSDTFAFTETTLPVSTAAINFIEKDTLFAVGIPVHSSRPQYLAEFQLICSSVAGCDTLKILGQDTICSKLPVYTYNLYKNSGCSAPVQWEYDPVEIRLIYSDNNSISLQFVKSGNIRLKATLYSDCIPIKDSMIIHVYNSPDTLDLGADTILCNAASVILRAGPGFKTYSWQDGSADSLYTATTAGIYYVTVTDSCNNVFSDTVNISADSFMPFDLGSDTSKCNMDSVLLQINTGFNNYTWSPNINMIPVSPTAVRVYPAVNMYYYVSANKLNGCSLKDSIYITVNRSPLINLGPDVRLCLGDSLHLNAGSGFTNYTWSTGQVTSSIYVYSVGVFYVTATDVNQCKSTDTAKVLQLFSLPRVHLTNDTSICSGQQKLLDAGAGFSVYTWNTGSSAQIINISVPGIYWVRVTDINGCKGSDTAYIKQTLIPPSQFLAFKDTSVCRYDSVRLNTVHSFSNYLWNTGSIAPIIYAGNPGLYWLQVTDEFGCKGTDTVAVIARNCNKGIYFPNSFTPNRDGLNDVYKPSVYGYLDFYIIRIFNRWGEKVFESNDLLKGWNGESRSRKHDQGAFSWICTYRFKGAKMEMERGTFLLLR